MQNEQNIKVLGAKVNNLKDVDVEIPRGKLVVITGVSGSGKSSLAFDTLYAEGQRRYVESLSSYARQFMGKMPKPECKAILGLPPAIAIEQKVNTRNPRSTVGTSTEIYDYLRLLFGRVGHTFSPISSEEVRKHTIDDVVRFAMTYPEGSRMAITAPVTLPEGRKFASQLDVYLKAGYSRLMRGGEFIDIDELLTEVRAAGDGADYNPADYQLLVDRLAVSSEADEQSRLRDSVESAFFEGRDRLKLQIWADDGIVAKDFSRVFEADGMTFEVPTDMMFNFNNPVGACPTCEGFGKVMGIDERLVIPNNTLSIYDNAVACWRGDKMSEWKKVFISDSAQFGFPIHKPYLDLSQEEKDLLWHGPTDRQLSQPGIKLTYGDFPSIDRFFRMVDENLYKIQYRVMKARYQGKTVCPACHGSRLKKTASYVKVGGATIGELVSMPVSRLIEFFRNLQLDATDAAIAERLLKEINNRISYLEEVGLGYLTLDRLSSTLSGGESQRINLATSLGSSLVGSLYILDEPSIGLHSRDTERLITVLKKLRDLGNTVVVVEHDEEIMRAADYLIDVGPDAGRLGGQIIYQGNPAELVPSQAKEDSPLSYTARYLTGTLSIPVPKQRRKWRDSLEVIGAKEHNLKDIDVKFPLGVMTVVTGVSGSGKSTLVRDILFRALNRHLGNTGDAPGTFRKLQGDLSRIKNVEFVDQNPIGKSSRSNPATYLKAFDEIRKLFASTQGAKQMGYSASDFSFNSDGGRCEECKGDGYITIEMQFMADITIPCESCHGKRYQKEILEIEYRGKNIYDILEMTINQAVEFFGEEAGAQEKRIIKRLKPLQDVGLGYIKIGQNSSSLSGGENQRVKLASFFAEEKPEPTMYIFDEPTTGLHFHDIATLMKSFDRLISMGHTILIIEHNMDVIKCADHVIDIGPEGGDAGGNLVAAGTPEQIAANPASYTGHFLKEKLQGV
ncbi:MULTISPECIES: excinuclease ABC subunit UvrA [Duncaniella]|uniref:excinuclease ABC subunit UvrA n=1 Tax=Duncaniella TaxID=2518495 RepID=UPI0010A3CBDC|nr:MULTISPECIES: excinuclease ABC subunit UvrA [Duncaniella]QCD39813.1 excinuclease ABC subunit A [Duncaniella sp. C9]QCP73460.1 excinuclease ABC subunit A [Duncaniella sp. B8]